MRESLIARSLVLALVLAVGAMGWACNGDDGETDVDTDVQPDTTDVPDDGVQPDIDVTDPIPDQDVDQDVEPDGEPDLPPDTLCPAACQDIPAGGAIGAACATAATCDHAADCYSEDIEIFNSEMYVSFYQGACILYGAGAEGCDPDVATTCPPGSTCIYMGMAMGNEYYGCWDSCEPVDTSGNPYDYSCGCRIGYECSITAGACFSGCSHDRECCERWFDTNDDRARQPDEVVVKEGCTNTCDNGGLFDDTTPEPGDCTVSFSCINNGDSTNVWSGPCEGDAWCPADGRCLDDFWYVDDVTGEPYYPGGICIKDACNYVGRGCTDNDGACGNLGTTDDPFYVCVGTCHFGREITATDYECRTTAGQEHACIPVDGDFWYSAPTDGSDGFCWSGYNAGGTKIVGESCADETECESPLGVGFCLEYTVEMNPYCTIQCNASHADLCGGDDGTGTAEALCAYGYCWEGCETAGGDLGANGCNSVDNACYELATFISASDYTLPTSTTAPVGVCFPKCQNDAWCTEMFVMATTCNTTTGICG